MNTPFQYEPNPTVLKQLQHVTLVAVVGPSGVGKTTLMQEATLQAADMHMVIGDTTRQPRPGERHGVDYFFESQETVKHGIERGMYVQVAPSVTGDVYVTRPESYGTEGIAVLAVLADALAAFRALPFQTVRSLFIVPPSFEIWQTRMGVHDFTDQQYAKRMAEARQSCEFALHDSALQFIINDELQVATQDFIALSHGRALTSAMKVKQDQARDIVARICRQL